MHKGEGRGRGSIEKEEAKAEAKAEAEAEARQRQRQGGRKGQGERETGAGIREGRGTQREEGGRGTPWEPKHYLSLSLVCLCGFQKKRYNIMQNTQKTLKSRMH